MKPWVSILAAALLVLLVDFTVQFSQDPSYQYMSVDSAAFAYCGSVITGGGLMYRDCWDNKTPGVYYLNAFALFVGGGHLWVLWLFQALWVALTGFVFYLTLRRIWGSRTAILSTLLFLLTLLYPRYYNGGNLTETYALVFIVLTIGSLYSYLKTGKNLCLVWVGLWTAGGFLLKPTYISMGAAAGLLIVYFALAGRDWRGLARRAAILLGSLLVPLGLVALYWTVQGSFADLWFAAFTHNRLYVQAGFSLSALLVTLRAFWTEMPLAAVTWLAIAAAIVYLARHGRELLPGRRQTADRFFPGKSGAESARLWLMPALLAAALLDIIFTAVSGKNFGHYFQVPLVTLSSAGAYLIAVLFDARGNSPANRTLLNLGRAAVVVVALLWGAAVARENLPSRGDLRSWSDPAALFGVEPTPIQQYIVENSAPEQPVLVWGYDPVTYLITGRRAPTRFVFLRHLFTPMPDGRYGMWYFLEELEQNPPEIILSDKNIPHGIPFLGGPDEEMCPGCPEDLQRAMDEFLEYFQAHYEYRLSFQYAKIYRRVK